MKSIKTPLSIALGTFVLGTSVAFASMNNPMSTTQPQQSSPAVQNGPSTTPPPMPSSSPQAGAQPMMPAAPQAGPAVSHGELMKFVAAVREIGPLTNKMRGEAMAKGVSKAKQRQLQQTYSRDVQGILAKNHLSAGTYEMLMSKAQKDPQFAHKVEAAIKSGS